MARKVQDDYLKACLFACEGMSIEDLKGNGRGWIAKFFSDQNLEKLERLEMWARDVKDFAESASGEFTESTECEWKALLSKAPESLKK